MKINIESPDNIQWGDSTVGEQLDVCLQTKNREEAIGHLKRICAFIERNWPEFEKNMVFSTAKTNVQYWHERCSVKDEFYADINEKDLL